MVSLFFISLASSSLVVMSMPFPQIIQANIVQREQKKKQKKKMKERTTHDDSQVHIKMCCFSILLDDVTKHFYVTIAVNIE